MTNTGMMTHSQPKSSIRLFIGIFVRPASRVSRLPCGACSTWLGTAQVYQRCLA